MRVIIAGSRTATASDVREAIRLCRWSGLISVVVSGAAAGADLEGERWAAETGRSIDRMPADWKKHGKSAGPIRNREMAKTSDGLIAVWDGTSRGTDDMVATASHEGLRVFTFVTTTREVRHAEAKGEREWRWEDVEERAGRIESDGGSRSDAERLAVGLRPLKDNT